MGFFEMNWPTVHSISWSLQMGLDG